MTDNLWNPYLEDKIQLARAVSEHLFANLPGSHQSLVDKLSGLTPVDKELQDLIGEEEDVKACRPYSDALIPYAVTPIRIVGAINATGNLLKRAQRRNILPPDQPIYLSYPGAASEDGSTVNRASIILAISSAFFNESTASAVFHWMIEIAYFRPYLFMGYRSEPKEEKLLLHSTAKLGFKDRLSRQN